MSSDSRMLRYLMPTGALLAMLFAAGFAVRHLVAISGVYAQRGDYSHLSEAVLLLLLFGLMIGLNTSYFIVSLGFERKRALGRHEAQEARHAAADDELLLLIPSYKEERDVVFQTMVSAALVEYPRRCVVLLIDDPATPANAADAARLAAARHLPVELEELFEPVAARFERSRADFEERARQAVVPAAEAARLARLYEEAAAWLEQLITSLQDGPGMAPHADRLFLERILRDPARAHRGRAAELLRTVPEPEAIAREYARLASLFRVRFASFERKRYVNLSHTPNKAMNLSAYLGLLGRRCREVEAIDGLRLESAPPDEASLCFPDPEFIVTVDADSLITSDYALRLVDVMRRPGNERIAVAQCPYTAVPDAPHMLERAASASTDAQFFTHHGMDYFGGSFWVGAAALMRRAALDDIARVRVERGHRVKVFIDDRIQIEDAAATVDLIDKGWRIYHDMGRLSYSATPADFGALVIQRRRWANGGLLILPKLLRYALKRPLSWRRMGESLIRLPTLLSPMIGGFCLLVLLLFPFDDAMITPWIVAAALPYFALYGRDLCRAGYRWRDLPRVYALNLLLVPVLIGGTLQSLHQAWSGRSLPFRRTPKIVGRSAAPLIYVAAPCSLTTAAILFIVFDIWRGAYWHLSFNLFNGAIFMYAIVRLIGLRAIWADIRAGLSRRRAAPEPIASPLLGKALR